MWQPIEGFWGDRYIVSRKGDVLRADGFRPKQWKCDQGYMLIRLSKPRAVVKVHRLVATAFCENPEAKPFVNHLNNKRDDNRAANLEWCTQRENLAHASRQGRMQRDYWKGKRSPSAGLTDETVAIIRDEYAQGGISWEKLGRKHGVSKRTIGRLLTGDSYANAA